MGEAKTFPSCGGARRCSGRRRLRRDGDSADRHAILGGQDVMVLGERGQAKWRLVRGLTALVDEETPVVKGAEIAENPFRPITAKGAPS